MHLDPNDSTSRVRRAQRVLEVEAQAIAACARRVGESFTALVDRLLRLEGSVAVTGVGKSGIIGEKISATLASTGTRSFFLRPVEALHGDLGMLGAGDVLLAISNSGETHEVLAVVHAAKQLGTEVVAFTGRLDSSLGREAAITLDVSVEREACPLDLAPTASTTVTLALGDALAMVLLEERGFTREHYARFHPGGSLGQRLRYRVRDLMRSGDLLPLVREDATLAAAVEEMTRRENLGVTVVVDALGALCGVVTDGDLRRALMRAASDGSSVEAILSRPVSRYMTRRPQTITPDAAAADALQHMEARGITALAVIDSAGRPAGVVHLHDILGRGKIVL